MIVVGKDSNNSSKIRAYLSIEPVEMANKYLYFLIIFLCSVGGKCLIGITLTG